MTSSQRTTRRAEIRDAMLGRAARRRRMRVLVQGSLIACVAIAAIGTAWFVARPPTTPLAPAESIASADRSAQAAPSHEIVPTTMVVDRAISDDELLDLLGEAGEQAGLAIIDGRARLVRWHEEPGANTEDLGPSGARPDGVVLAES